MSPRMMSAASAICTANDVSTMSEEVKPACR